MQFGRFYETATSATAAAISPCFGKMGTGANVPGTTETSINSVMITASNYARANISRIGLSISCTGTNQTAGIPDGVVFLGSADGVVDREFFSSFTALAAALATRRWMRNKSTFGLMQKPAHLAAFPLDFITYNDFVRVGGVPSGSDVCSDGLSPILVYIPASVNVNNFIIELYVEWKVIYSTDNVLANSHVLHPSLRDDEVHDLTTAANDLAGFIYEVGAAGAAPLVHTIAALSF